MTYYSQNRPLKDIRSDVVDLTTPSKDDVHISWTEIRNFELRVSSEFSFNYDVATNLSEASGEALTFAGFEPHISDIFLYTLRNGRIGVFSISEIQRLAIGQDTYHKINFTLQEFATPAFVERLRKQTSVVSYFDKTKFLVGNNAMLTTQGFIDKKELEHLREEIIQNYYDRFFSPDFDSFMRPDNVYDPYVVEYWNQKVPYHGSLRRPAQLLITVENYKKTIWSLLTANPIKKIRNIAHNFKIDTYHATFWHTDITALLEHQYIKVGDEKGGETQAFSNGGYNGMVQSATPLFHTLIWNEDIKKRSDALFHSFKHWYYGPFPAHQTCAPSIHYNTSTEYPYDEAACKHCPNLGKCEWHPEMNPFHRPGTPGGHPHTVVRDEQLTEPYPILSNDELMDKWLEIHHVPTNRKITDAQLAQIRGYISWYRETYKGTLSRSELEYQWRTAADIKPEAELTPEENEGLLEYIQSYRSQFKPVLTDSELEVEWRNEVGIDQSGELSEKGKEELNKYILEYRELHGKVPNDGLEDIDESIEPASYVPLVFYPKIQGHYICPNMCHFLCDQQEENCEQLKIHSTTEKVDNTFYALSQNFYENSVGMPLFEQVLHDLLDNKDVDPQTILKLVEDYLEWDDTTAFYYELFALYMIDKSLFWIMYHS